MLRVLFTKIEEGDAAVTSDLADMLAAHMTVEHELFYPVARDIEEELVTESFEQHALAELALKRVLAVDPGEDLFEARVKVLKALIEQHVEHEESMLFSAAESALAPDELESLGLDIEFRFQEILDDGYRATLPNTFEQTAADIALSEQFEGDPLRPEQRP